MDTRNGRKMCALVALLLLAGWTRPLAADEAAPGTSSQLQVKHLGDGQRVRVEVGNGRGNSVKLVPFPEDFEEDASAPKSAATTQPERLRVPTAPRAMQGVQFSDADSADDSHAFDARDARQPGTVPKQVERLPATAISPKSDFRPRFRTPGVRQAQHVEPDAADRSVEHAAAESRGALQEPIRDDRPAAAALPRSEPAPLTSSGGKGLIEAAYAKSKQIETDADYSEIIDLCRRARELGLKPSHEQYADNLMSWAYNRRGEAWIDQQRDDEALADFEAAAEANPNSWRAIHNRGVSYAALGRIEQAIADFDRTIELNPRYANAYFNRGELLYARGRMEDAIADYKVAIDLGPTDAAMHNSLGHTYYRLQRIGDALREYGKSLALDPNYAPALVNRGDAYVDVGRYGDAAADYRAAITADPNMARAYQAAAWLMATCPDSHYRDDKLAVEAASKALALDNKNYRNLETLAAAQASAGQFAEAKATQEKAIASVPRDQLVAAEKRMALYQKDLAFREVSRQDLIAANQARKEDEAEKKKFPVRQATAEAPLDEPGHVVVPDDSRDPVRYPEDQFGYDGSMEQAPMAAPKKRGFLPSQFNPFNRSPEQQPQQNQPRNLPKKPTRPRPQQQIRPW